MPKNVNFDGWYGVLHYKELMHIHLFMACSLVHGLPLGVREQPTKIEFVTYSIADNKSSYRQ